MSDGTLTSYNIDIGNEYTIHIIRDDDYDNWLIYKAHDEFYNDIIFYEADNSGDFLRQYIQINAYHHEYESTFKYMIYETGMDFNLADGRYTFELKESQFTDNFNMKLAHTEYIVKNGILYYFEETDNVPIDVIEGNLIYFCNENDMVMIDCSKIFKDKNDDFLYYNTSLWVDSFHSETGFNEHMFHHQMSGNTEEFYIYATDMYGDTLRKKVTLVYSPEKLPIDYID